MVFADWFIYVNISDLGFQMIEILEGVNMFCSNSRGSSDNYLHEMELFVYICQFLFCCKMKDWYMKLPLSLIFIL